MQPKYLLFLRAVLAETLLLQSLYSPGMRADRLSLWCLLASYAAAALLVFRAAKRRPLPDAWVLGSFILDIVVTSAVLYLADAAGTDLYVAYFLIILSSCFLERLSHSFLVGGMACLVYAALAFPGESAWQSPFFLLRLSLLLVTAFFSAYVVDHARRIQERLAWAQRLSMVGHAMSAVLHEVKTPLGTILLNAEAAREALRKGKKAESHLKLIEQEAERASEILRDFLELSRPKDLELKPLALAPVVRKAVQAMRTRLDERNITLDERIEGLGGMRIHGSERHLIQVLVNVLMNAVDAMPMGGSLTLRQSTDGMTVRLVAVDTGMGIPKERLESVFEPFNTSKAESGGHGLGLSIARWILHKHSGDIELSSGGQGRGTTVQITLPLIVNGGSSSPAGPAPAGPGAGSSSGSRRS